jgi:hypothetical protein
MVIALKVFYLRYLKTRVNPENADRSDKAEK